MVQMYFFSQKKKLLYKEEEMRIQGGKNTDRTLKILQTIVLF